MKRALFFTIILLITNDFTSGKSIGNKIHARRQTRSAQGVYLQGPGFGYGYEYGYNQGHGFNSFQPDFSTFGGDTVFPDYPYEAGVYYNYPHNRHHDLAALGSVNRLYPYGGYSYQNDLTSGINYPRVGQYPGGYQPSYSPGYGFGDVAGVPRVPGVPRVGVTAGIGGIHSVGYPSSTPIPFIPTHWSSTPASFPNNFYNNLDRQPGLLHNPSTVRPSVLIDNRTPGPINRVPLGVSPGKTGLDLPEPNLHWQLPNRQF